MAGHILSYTVLLKLGGAQSLRLFWYLKSRSKLKHFVILGDFSTAYQHFCKIKMNLEEATKELDDWFISSGVIFSAGISENDSVEDAVKAQFRHS